MLDIKNRNHTIATQKEEFVLFSVCESVCLSMDILCQFDSVATVQDVVAKLYRIE